MMLTDRQIANLAKGQGLTDSQAVIATAIALAESGGNPDAHNAKPPDDSYGLWQVNMHGSLGPQRRQQFDLTSDSDLFNPTVNARAMRVISSGGVNWRPWSVFTNGSYLRFIPRANEALGVTTVSSSPIVTAQPRRSLAPLLVSVLVGLGAWWYLKYGRGR